ncbi:MAG: Ig-like domain repeat protein [Oscillospiraceae bacterium]|nr:Ig-like domain repeat protein [Oscillospiraceae bacterium]
MTPAGLCSGDNINGITLTASTGNIHGGTITPSAVGIQNSNGEDVPGCYNITYQPGNLTINKAPAPAITWPTAGTITYGQKLSDSHLTGVQNGVAPTGEITITGNGETKNLPLTNGTAIHQWNGLADQKYTVTAEYSGNTNYKAASGSLTFDAAKQQQAALSIKDVGTKIYGEGRLTSISTAAAAKVRLPLQAPTRPSSASAGIPPPSTRPGQSPSPS